MKSQYMCIGLALCCSICVAALGQADESGQNPPPLPPGPPPPLPNMNAEVPPLLPPGLAEKVEVPPLLPPELQVETEELPLEIQQMLDSTLEPPSSSKNKAEPAARQEAKVMTDPAMMPKDDISFFSHVFHVEKSGYTCKDCHNSIFQQVAGTAKAKGDFTMASFEQGTYCGACHDGSTAFSVTDQDSCVSCHGTDMKPSANVIFKRPVKAVIFEHDRHVNEFGIKCFSCHQNLFAAKKGASEKRPDFTMESIYQGKYCGACHDGTVAFSAKTRCTRCHLGKQSAKRLYANKQDDAAAKD